MLGVKPMMGRDFYDEEDKPGAADTVILSYAHVAGTVRRKKRCHWSDGRAEWHAKHDHRSAAADFQFAPRGKVEFWATIHTLTSCEKRRSCHNLYGVARLKDGVTVQMALADMTGIAKQLEVQYPGTNRGQGASVMPLYEEIVGDIRPILLMLLGGAGFCC